MSISQNFPDLTPSLNLNFAGSKKLDSRITFTRGSTGTYMDDNGIIRTAGINQPRFDHSYDGTTIESLGLLIEESRTNLFPWSETFISGWGGGGTPNLDSSIVDPRGNTGTVYYITASEWTRNFDGGGATIISLSFFTKVRSGGSGNKTAIQMYQETAIGEPSNIGSYDFDMVGNNPDSGRFTNIIRTQYPNGWYRFTCRVTSNASAGSGSFTSTSRLDLEGGITTNYVWGIQVEAGSFATSYIPTAGSTVTRSADNASITGTNFTNCYNSTEYTLLAVARTFRTTSFPAVASINDGTFNNVASLYFSPGSPISASYWRNSGVQYGINGSALNSISNVNTKMALAVKTNDWGFAQNGSSQSSGSGNGVVPTGVTRLTIGNGDTDLNGTIAQISYYPKRLTNSQLQNLTR